MSLSCIPSKPNPSPLARQIQQVNRDVGLSPIFNVPVTVSPCIEDFTNPTFYMSGATKPITGLTITSEGVYNLSEIDEFDLIFNFTGSTDYTEYTGNFCFGLIPSLSSNLISDRCTKYSNLTGSSITSTFDTTEVSSVDNSYVIRPWNTFVSKCFTNTRGKTGTTINTSTFTPIDTSYDHYIVTTINPPKPVLQRIPFNLFTDIQFMNDTIFPTTVNGSSVFELGYSPIDSKVVLNVNGLTVSNDDYIVNDKLITLSGVTLESTDIVQAYYNKTSLVGAAARNLDELVKLEIFSVSGITTGFTSNFSATTYSNLVNYNDTNNRVEIFLKDKIDPSVQPILTINGVNLSFNIDFFKSNIVHNKIILGEGLSLEIGDVVTVYYYYSGINNPGDLGTLYTDSPTISWSSQSNLLRSTFSNGTFTVEMADRNDPSFTTILKTGTTVYNNGLSEYNLIVGPITTTNVTDYIYRIKFDKQYVDDYGNGYNTLSYSDIGSFRLKWSYISNTNF